MVAKPLCPLYKNIIKPLDRARYPELRYNMVREVYNRGFKFYYVDEYVSIFDLNGYSKANAWLQLKEVADICNAKHSFSYYVEIIKFNLKRIINRILFR